MSNLNKERSKSLDQVQKLVDEKGRIMREQAETGKNFSVVLADLERRLRNALGGKNQESK